MEILLKFYATVLLLLCYKEVYTDSVAILHISLKNTMLIHGTGQLGSGKDRNIN